MTTTAPELRVKDTAQAPRIGTERGEQLGLGG